MKTLTLFSLFLLVSCGRDETLNLIKNQTYGGTTAGQAVEIKYRMGLSKEFIDSSLSARTSLLSGKAQESVHIYTFTYVTNDANQGNDTFLGSGSIIIPNSVFTSDNPTAPWVVVNHGTIVDNASAPTNNISEGLLEASLGFITIVPDYIGFGASYNSDPSVRIHPYIIAKSYASDGLNMMNAAKSALEAHGITLGRLYLKGYSEGGYATLALQREIEKNHGGTFTITASAPSAGPYSTVGMGATLTNDPGKYSTISPTLFGYLTTSYYYNYPDISNAYSLSAILNQSSNYDVVNLFNGTKSSTETEAVYASLGISTISGLLDSDLVTNMGARSGAIFDGYNTMALTGDDTDFGTAITGTTEKFTLSLLANDLLMDSNLNNGFLLYFPSVLTIFYHCTNDTTIALSATEGAVTAFNGVAAVALGSANVRKRVDFPTATHGDCPHALLPALCFAQIEAAGGDESALPDVADETNYCHGN